MDEDSGSREDIARGAPVDPHDRFRYSQPPHRRREPVFNLPPFVAAFSGLLVAIHLTRSLLVTEDLDRWTVLLFAFIPARYGEFAYQLPVPLAAVWSPITYSLLHGGWTHLLMNLFWLIAFASPVARRLGTWRTTAIAIVASLGGAIAHGLAFAGEMVPMLGASAVVAGFMGAAARFAFMTTGGTRLNIHGPAQTLVESFTNPRFLAFVFVWMGLNYLFGTGVVPIAGEGVAIAWQAHVGGFFAGLLAFSVFDRG